MIFRADNLEEMARGEADPDNYRDAEEIPKHQNIYPENKAGKFQLVLIDFP